LDDPGRFKQLQEALTTMNVSAETQHAMWSTLAGILQLGNVQFEENSESYADITPDTFKYVERAASVFGIPTEALAKRLTSRSIKVQLQVIETSLTLDEAPLSRDGKILFLKN